jgi:hypothetical protein
MITFILIGMFGLLAIAFVLLAWARGKRPIDGKSGPDNRTASQEPTVGRATGID